MTTAELLELLHTSAKLWSTATAHVEMTSVGRDRRGRAGTGQGEVLEIEVSPRQPERGQHRLRRHFSEWQQCAFDPNVVIPELWLEPVGPTVVAGRDGITVRARPRPTTHDYFVLPMSAEAYELVVDIERGILLRLACIVDGEETLVYEITSIDFDR